MATTTPVNRTLVSLKLPTRVPGLTPAAVATFRYRPVTKAGEGNWSQPLSVVVK
jgi:hypothetical protein